MSPAKRASLGVLALSLAVLACKRGLTTGPTSAPALPAAGFSLVAVIPSSGNGVALDLEDNLYVVEYTRDPYRYSRVLNQQVVKYSRDWNRVLSFGGQGEVDVLAHRSDPDQAAGSFSGLLDVAVDYCGNIYTLEEGQQSCYQCTWQNSRVQKFDSSGAYVSQVWGDPTAGTGVNFTGILSGSNAATVRDMFDGARFVECSADGYVVVAKSVVPNIVVLDMTKPSLALSGSTPGTQTNPAVLYVTTSHDAARDSPGFSFIPDRPASGAEAGGGFFGTKPVTLGGVVSTDVEWLRLDPFGRVRIYTLASASVTNFTRTKTHGGGVPYGPQLGVVPSCGGSQNYNMQITHYAVAEREPPVAVHLYAGTASSAVSFIGTMGKQGPGAGELSDPRDPRFDSRGFLYVSDPNRNVVNVYRPTRPL